METTIDQEILTVLAAAWSLSPAVALRPEPFGALAYHFGNRRLTFLKRMDLVTVVTTLAEHHDLASTLTAAGIGQEQHAAYAHAVLDLESAGVLTRRETLLGSETSEEEKL